MRIIPCPEPGIYRGIPMDDYLAWDAVSNSDLNEIQRSPAHYQASLRLPNKDSDAFLIGNAAHTAVLEPERFEDAFYQIPWADPEIYRNQNGSESKKPASTGAYKEAVANLVDANPGQLGLSQKQWEDSWRMRKSALCHPKVAKIMGGSGEAELSIVFIDPATGILCKMRMDWYVKEYAGGLIADLKTTPDASPWAFGGAANKWGYYRKGAFYIRGAKAAGLPTGSPCDQFALVAMEKEPLVLIDDEILHGCVLYRLQEEHLSLGDSHVNYALALYAECERTGQWPAYPTDVVDLTMPGWAGQDVERNTEDQTA